MENLSKKDMTALLINAMYVKLLLAIPRNLILIAGNGAWILSIVLTLFMLLIFYIITKFYDFKKSLPEFESRVSSIIIGVAATLILIFSMASVVKIYPETVKIILLKNTPIEIISVVTAVAAILGARAGIEAIARISSLFQPIAAFIAVFCFLLLIPHMKFSNLTPILPDEPLNIFTKGLSSASGFSDIILLFILPFMSKDKNEYKKIGYRAIITMGTIMTLVMLTYCLIFPAGISKTYLLPIYQMIRLVEVGDFFGRFEALFELVWSISILLYYSIYLYALSVVWQKAFGLKYKNPLIAPFMAIISILVYTSGSYAQVSKNYTWYSFALLCSTVLIIFISALIFKKEEKNK